MSSKLFNNIKYLCWLKGVKVYELEQDYYTGKLGALERSNRMYQAPLDLIYFCAKKLGVTVEDLVEKDYVNETELEKVRRQIEELEAKERKLLAEREGGMDVNY